jgi:hypothetical protein
MKKSTCIWIAVGVFLVGMMVVSSIARTLSVFSNAVDQPNNPLANLFLIFLGGPQIH